jgi:glycosyltransferase involved in cell wall biosynthesis
MSLHLSDLAALPAGRTGWPWAEESRPSPDTMPDGRLWPKVSIVTPSFNQGQFLEETIRSVLLQGYSNLEYIIMDGGSTDNSVEIIRKYEPWLAYWVSEKDRGQSHAINKGFARATGEIVAWLNSDDVYEQCAIEQAAQHLSRHLKMMLVYGQAKIVDDSGEMLSYFPAPPFSPPQMFFEHFVPQPAAFLRRSILQTVGEVQESLHFCMDYELYLRIALTGSIGNLPSTWARFRIHAASKGSNLQALRWVETAAILSRYFARTDLPPKWQRYRSQAVGRAHWRAAIEYYREHDISGARRHVEWAIEILPNFPGSRDFARILVGGRASQLSDGTLDFVSGFFNLIPDSLAHKQKGHNQARARVNALLALNPSLGSEFARLSARDALRNDPFWFSNRHVVRRAL